MNTIVTISRQIGSGGRSIGRLLAKELGIPFYDRAIIDLAAEESGLSADFIHQGEQNLTTSLLFNAAISGLGWYGGDISDSLGDKIFRAESTVIQALAEKGPSVMVGRCADYILRDRPCLNVFIYADTTLRVKRLAESAGVSEKDAEKMMKLSDKQRSRHYEHYTGRRWGDMKNYHLCLSGGAFSHEDASRLLEAAYHALDKGASRR